MAKWKSMHKQLEQTLTRVHMMLSAFLYSMDITDVQRKDIERIQQVIEESEHIKESE